MRSESSTDPIFEANRSYLTALAYRMTGSVADAEDVVQEAYLRWERVDPEAVEKPRAFLSRTVTRLCLDLLKSARSRREAYVGPWLPEPIVDGPLSSAAEPTELAEDVSVALMLALERLSPLERAAFLLRDVFDFEYSELARILGRSEGACRQLASRAKKHVTASGPRYRPSPDEYERVVAAFGAAVTTGDLERLEATLAEDAVLYADGGGRVRSALRPVHGANRIARFFLGVLKKFPLTARVRILARPVNGAPGYVIVEDGKPVQTIAFDVHQGRVHAVYVVRNPDKLRRLEIIEA